MSVFPKRFRRLNRSINLLNGRGILEMKNRKMIGRNIKIKFAWITVLLFTVLLASTLMGRRAPSTTKYCVDFHRRYGLVGFFVFRQPGCENTEYRPHGGGGNCFRAVLCQLACLLPSRVAILTGNYPDRWRISSFLAYRSSNKVRGWRIGWIPKPRCWPP